MTGAEKSAGDHARQGIRSAVDGMGTKADHLVLRRRVAVRQADARSDASAAEAEAVRLVSVNRVVALLGGTNSAQAEQLARGADAVGVPVVVQAALPKPGETTFSMAPSLGRRGQVLGKYTAAVTKAEKIAVCTDERSNAAGPVADAFARQLPRDGAPRFSFKKADEFPQVVGSAASVKPQAVLFVGSGRDLARFRGELQKALPSVTVFFGGDESSLPALLDDRAGGEGVYLATSYIAGDESAANQDFVKKYEEQFHEPPDVNAALAYDGTRLLAEAIRKAGAITAAKVRDALAETDGFESVTGALKFGKDRHAKRPLFVVQIKNGQPVLQKRYGTDD
jgi:branched-chain amino acid transport system substrate-binding protein